MRDRPQVFSRTVVCFRHRFKPIEEVLIDPVRNLLQSLGEHSNQESLRVNGRTLLGGSWWIVLRRRRLVNKLQSQCRGRESPHDAIRFESFTLLKGTNRSVRHHSEVAVLGQARGRDGDLIQNDCTVRTLLPRLPNVNGPAIVAAGPEGVAPVMWPLSHRL